MNERKRSGASPHEVASDASADGTYRHDFRDADQQESRRILDLVQREAFGLEAMSRHTMKRMAQHITVGDANAEDAVELWSARIGRALGLIVSLAIMGWLLFHLLQS
ncbi:hypothetical protein ACFO1V_00715 [Daeguia caeni]|uniref:DUF1640 domain-containing protein n=1 Tax=Daeguia caeni TaxID=439612 RepID=A0ABV9H2Q0_9HYPH